METNSDGFFAFIGASKKACTRGDYLQAEKLLKSSLKRAEQQRVAIAHAVVEIMECLLEVYKEQGKDDDVSLLQERLDQLCLIAKDERISSTNHNSNSLPAQL
ncbi:MAG: hypothetical protein K2X93_22720 [Candidatus Obscuribacterales bacterium]|nr:hypothetical protein [Candidatus Obscuribacterales bacterium]